MVEVEDHVQLLPATTTLKFKMGQSFVQSSVWLLSPSIYVRRGSRCGCPHVVVDANLDILPLLFLLLDETSRETAAPCIDDVTALFPSDRRVQTEILSTGEAEAPELLLVPEPFSTEFHQSLQLDQRLFDLGHCP